MNFSSMTPEQAFAHGVRTAFEMTANQGRFGDSELAHVNPQEKAMLEARGGSGTTNPATGMREYFGGNSGDFGGSDGTDSFGGGGEPGDDGLGGGDGPSGGSSGSGRRTDHVPESGDKQFGSGPAPDRGFGVSNNPSSKGGSPAAKADERSFGDRVADGISAALGFDRAKAAVSQPVDRDTAFSGFQAALGMAPGVGALMGLSRGLQAAGLESEADFSGMDDDQEGGNSEGVLSPAAPAEPAAQPVQAQFPWSRPSALPQAPAALGFDAGMTPLQQRAAIATGGTNADAGVYRDPSIMDFYRNLATFSLTDRKGRPIAGQSPLPVELQFLTQLGAQPGESTSSFLKALSGLRR